MNSKSAVISLAGVAAGAVLYSSFHPQISKICAKSKYNLVAYITEFVNKWFRSGLVPYPGDESISPQWITQLFRDKGVLNEENEVESVIVEDLQGNRGLTGSLCRLRLTYANSKAVAPSLPQTLILKLTILGVNNRRSAISAGQFREAVAYEKLDTHYAKYLPKIYFTYGSSLTGTQIILMEDLMGIKEAIGVNHLFGNQIWGANNTLSNPPDQVEVLQKMFGFAAELHAKHWNDRSLLNQDWVKGAGWYQGRDRARWELAIDRARSSWTLYKQHMASGDSGAQLAPKFIDIVDKSFASTSWDNLQKHLRDPTIPFTLCHGDFHAGNMIWVQSDSEQQLRVVDWSEVGVWEPTADLGQTIISDVKPEIWRDNQTDIKLLREYWEKLVSLGVSAEEYPFDLCLERYERAPVERWIWVFSVMSMFGLPAAAIQYFHDQILSFIEAHGDHEAYILKPVVCLI
ncbi:hypothetical protein K493DRAFT_333945 [Basidiobolus meristosporus CBS 931.73]|uniref:Aminoglycoside phosphotransferase domain-containing protein n=1 Tax=Basidiobolus meristosporus CBS 931.73 TaxID=1314790 RepID=A0A1Y1Z1Y4_9FUNG|nr:hypothetical protein K493DRAFT_333945 [Basidiobolus meristosporus CBS 931.73]|eukprot:ORY04308.1 hypothetical protein K493DRAFT_333945 [Basidiobolus meristosporus CBS 931.73]